MTILQKGELFHMFGFRVKRFVLRCLITRPPSIMLRHLQGHMPAGTYGLLPLHSTYTLDCTWGHTANLQESSQGMWSKPYIVPSKTQGRELATAAEALNSISLALVSASPHLAVTTGTEQCTPSRHLSAKVCIQQKHACAHPKCLEFQ